ncbi:TPA: glycine cleavage system protein GcvH [Candidatus Poribacteria bacterium]|nr:glycine cleavage system protein GcvH [Candidatus Poribacteria bacterium]HEX28723.1 glycine cleavage system protein GcvH [Candidatus Poribacteria bacterium]
MSLIRYTRNHEWIEVEGEIGTVGITERWLAERGEVVYVELPEIGDEYEKEEPIALVESMDGTEYHVLAPVTGEVVEINEELEDDVDLINRSPEGDGWLFKMRIEMRRELKSLMNLDEYEDFEEEDYEEFEITDLGEEELL